MSIQYTVSYDEMNHCSFIEIASVRNKIRAGFSSAIILLIYILIPHQRAAHRRVGILFCFLFFYFFFAVTWKSTKLPIIISSRGVIIIIIIIIVPHIIGYSANPMPVIGVVIPEPINNLFSITLLLCDLTFSYVPPPPHASQNRRRLVYFIRYWRLISTIVVSIAVTGICCRAFLSFIVFVCTVA